MTADLPFTSVNLPIAQPATAAVVPGTELSKRVLYKSIVGEKSLLQQNGCTKKVTECGCFVLDHVCRRGYNIKDFCVKAEHDTCTSANNTQAESCEHKNDEWIKHNLVSSIEWYRVHLNARSQVLSGLNAFAQSIRAHVENKPSMTTPSLDDLQHYESDLSQEEQEQQELQRNGKEIVADENKPLYTQNASHLSSLNDPTSNDYVFMPSTKLVEEQLSAQKNILPTLTSSNETTLEQMQYIHKMECTNAISNTIKNTTQQMASTPLPTNLLPVKVEDCCANNSSYETSNKLVDNDKNTYTHANCTVSNVPHVATVKANIATPLVQVKLEKLEKEEEEEELYVPSITRDETTSHTDIAPSAQPVDSNIVSTAIVATTNVAAIASPPVSVAHETYIAPVQTSRFVSPPTYIKPVEANSRFVLPPTTSIDLSSGNAEGQSDNGSTNKNESIAFTPEQTTAAAATATSENGSVGNDSNVKESIPFLSTNFLSNIAVEAKERRNNPRLPLHGIHCNTHTKEKMNKTNCDNGNNTYQFNNNNNMTSAKNECSTTYLTPNTFTSAPFQSPTQELPSQRETHSYKNDGSSNYSRHRSRSLSSHSHSHSRHHHHRHHNRRHRSSSLQSSRNAAREFASEFECMSSTSSHSHVHTRKRSRETSAEYSSHHDPYRHSNNGNKREEYVRKEDDRRTITTYPSSSVTHLANAIANTHNKPVLRLDTPQSIIKKFKNCLILCKACRVMFPAGATKLRSHVIGSFHMDSVKRVKELWEEMKKKKVLEANPDTNNKNDNNNDTNADVDNTKSIAVDMENRSVNDMINELPAGALYKCVRTEHHGKLCDLSRLFAVIGCISAAEERIIHDQRNSFCDDGFDLVVTRCKVCNIDINPGCIINHFTTSEHQRKAKIQNPSAEPEKKSPPKKKERKNLYKKLEIIRKLLK